MQNINLEVRRIDYGDVACIPLQNIKELDDLAAALPEQALQVALANVRELLFLKYIFHS